MRRLFTNRNRPSTISGPELRDPQRELLHFRRRLLIAGAMVIVAFGGLLGRFVYLQLFQHRHYQTLAESNRIAIVPVVPNRGVMTDRNGVVLAQSYSAYTLEVTPSRVKNLDETIDGLATLVEVQARDRKRFKRLLEESKNFESLPLRTRLSDEEVARFAVNRYRFPGVEIKARLFRQYPFGEVASHVTGYISRINDKDVERIDAWNETANYKGSDYIGKVGVELAYERELHGTTGWEEVEVDAGGRAVRTLSRTPPISGNNLKLALDIRLQQAAEQAFGDRRGALVAIEPATGDVLAFVSKPGFDPNLFVDGIDPTNWELLNESPDKPLLNRPLRGAYPPGSTIKPFLALAALTSGKRTAAQTIFDPGFYQIAGAAHRFRDDKPGGHGYVDMFKSIVVSCDTYYYMLAGETDIDDTHAFLSQFGFGRKTGIDVEGELLGVLPSRGWKRERFKDKWYLGDSISAGIGQGYNAFTPVQQAQAIAIIANDGVALAPHLVKSIENVKDGTVRQIALQPTRALHVKPEHLAVIKNALVGVPREGTSAQAFVGTKYVSAGKTGTSQVYSLKGEKYSKQVDERLRDHAWYIAYAPADQPRIAIAVLVENGGFGAQAAAPIARAMFDYYLLGQKPRAPAAPGTGPREPEDESD
ncbi:MAG: penicillin-binding protein 2 [Betaproteobacteria bacterium 13_1_20CM_3_63_8]|nr:MAG: penicillin-binding protein 2 [Betaproteobacteria bacterium 13_1_20CM_3_63_8]